MKMSVLEVANYTYRFCQVDAAFTLILLGTSTVNLSERFRVLESRTTSSVNYGCDAKNRSSSGSLSRRAPNPAARFTSSDWAKFGKLVQ